MKTKTKRKFSSDCTELKLYQLINIHNFIENSIKKILKKNNNKNKVNLITEFDCLTRN